MKFECPHCQQHLECDNESAGMAVRCPGCNGEMLIPEPSDPNEAPSKELRDLKQTLQSDIDRGEMTITQFMAEQSMSGGVQLDASDSQGTASSVLTAEQGRKYKLGQVVASGGMGAILDAKDVNIRRSVAMKVMLDPDKVTKEQVLRFIEEAQITGQLEHPGIVPIYELGVDASGNVFYTMKLIAGVTLKEVLKKIAEGNKKTVGEYPLSHLLTIFQRVCDAIAYAHSKHVVHRDLKPENIMIGDFGEVLVLDWGLAKVLHRGQESGVRGQEENKDIRKVVQSVRGDDVSVDILKTMDGGVMGTPGFMAPEQASGETESIDERADIYALGAILYNILTLHKPIEGDTITDILSKTTEGDIQHPSSFGAAFAHLPNQAVPDSLSAVAMKALALEPGYRYQHVKELQKDIEAYQGGFATSAEDAGAWKQVKLFVGRHKGISVTAAAAVVVVVGLASASYVKILGEKRVADEQRDIAEDALTEVKQVQQKSAPSMLSAAKVMAEQGMMDESKDLLKTAIQYDPDLHQPPALLSIMLLSERKYTQARMVCEEGLKHHPDNSGLKWLLEMTDAGKKGKEIETGKLGAIVGKQGMPMLAAQFMSSADQKLDMYRQNIEEAWPGYGERLTITKEGEFRFDGSRMPHLDLLPLQSIPLNVLHLSETGVSDLTPLKGMPLRHLSLQRTKVVDLAPLKDMKLTGISLGFCQDLADIAPLKGMPLKGLSIDQTKVTDISALEGMPLTQLIAYSSRINDLTPLKGMPLKTLNINNTRVADLAPLKGMPLTSLDIGAIRASDLSPLEGMPLESLIFTPKRIRTGIDAIRNIPTLKVIGSAHYNMNPAQDFWKRYDAGEFK